MACSSCAAKARYSRGVFPQQRSLVAPIENIGGEQECVYTKEQIELKIDELTQLKNITSNKKAKFKISVSLFKLKKIFREYSEFNCSNYKSQLDGLL